MTGRFGKGREMRADDGREDEIRSEAEDGGDTRYMAQKIIRELEKREKRGKEVLIRDKKGT